MLYFLVGSRELDGGLMCTASHNPKAYTGAKLVREGAIALSGDTGIGDVRALIEAGLRATRRAAAASRASIYGEQFRAAALPSSTPPRSAA
jgi:phosphomannomutase